MSRSGGVIVAVSLLTLAGIVWWALGADSPPAGGVDDAPQNQVAEHPPPLVMRAIGGEGWSARVPDHWREVGEFYMAPDRANLLVNVRAIPRSIVDIADNTRKDLEITLPEYALLSERVDSRPDGVSHILEGRYQHSGSWVRTTTGVFERRGSVNKVVVTLSVVEERYADNAAVFGMILDSVRVE